MIEQILHTFMRAQIYIYKRAKLSNEHCVKSVRILSYSSLYFPAFGLNTKTYGISFRIQSECWKIRTRITRNTDTFHAVEIKEISQILLGSCFEKMSSAGVTNVTIPRKVSSTLIEMKSYRSASCNVFLLLSL